jgi:hypothetical protein
VEIIPVQYVSGSDVELESHREIYNTKAENDAGTAGTIADEKVIHNLTPKMKVIPKVRAVRESYLGTFRSAWVAGSAIVLGGNATGVPDPGGLTLTVTGTYRGFNLSWTDVADATKYNIYGKVLAPPSIVATDFVTSVEGNYCVVTWPYTANMVYFKVVPINSVGINASWQISGSGVMDTANDSLITSAKVAELAKTGGALSAGQSIDWSKLYTVQERRDSIEVWLNSLGVDDFSAAMKNYLLTADAGFKVISSYNITPPTGVNTAKGDSWIANGDYTIKRVVVTPANTGATFTNSTVVTLYKNGLSLIILPCDNSQTIASWTDADENLVATNEIFCRSAATGSAGAPINIFVEVIKRYT